MLENLEKYKVVLASNSPRRKELLDGLGIAYEVKTLPGIDESYPAHLQGEEIPLYIAKSKAAAYLNQLVSNELIITADTVVWVADKVLGKPADKTEAIEMLQLLSGKTHQVITAVCLLTRTFQHTFTALTEVSFARLSNEEINYYVDTYQPFDKAGAYGIQEWIGFIGVERISGSYFNVMGLPIQKLYRELAKIQ